MKMRQGNSDDALARRLAALKEKTKAPSALAVPAWIKIRAASNRQALSSAKRIAVLPGVFRNHPPLAVPGVAPTLHFVMVGIITAAGPVPPEVPGDYDMLRATLQVVHAFHFPHLEGGAAVLVALRQHSGKDA